MIASVLLCALAALLVADAWKLRGRLAQLPVLPVGEAQAATEHDHARAASEAAAVHGYRVIEAPGVSLGGATARTAGAYAAAHRLDVLDIVPRDLPALRAMTLATLFEPRTYTDDRLGPGRTAGHAFLVSTDVAARAQLAEPASSRTDLAYTRDAVRLKHFGRAGIAIAADAHARPADVRHRLDVLRAMIGIPSTTVALFALPLLWSLLAVGLVFRPVAGLVALAAWQLQPLITLAGGPIRSPDLALVTLLRAPIELVTWLRTLTGTRAITAEAAARRAAYATPPGPEVFEPRRQTCPLCDSRELRVHVRNPDLLQHKPGRFTLERCSGCGHIFQNPRLSLAGLDYYYRDFYDGLGEAGMEFVFGFGAQPYHARAKAVAAVAQPKRWLDVGCGHGHFCIAAREDLPGTTFDGLDLSESIDEAHRRGWIDTSYRGLFPELAPTFAGAYDAVSMSHYLEHTLDPRAELDAARTALAPGGVLMIEVPDPEYGLAKLLRGYWLPWFQPQHLNLVSVGNLERLLRERGLEPLVWHRGEAHQRVDFMFAVWMFLDHVAPAPHLPWRPRGAFAGAWRVGAWMLGAPFLIGAVLLDQALGPIISRGKRGNTYRVVARKTA